MTKNIYNSEVIVLSLDFLFLGIVNVCIPLEVDSARSRYMTSILRDQDRLNRYYCKKANIDMKTLRRYGLHMSFDNATNSVVVNGPRGVSQKHVDGMAEILEDLQIRIGVR